MPLSIQDKKDITKIVAQQIRIAMEDNNRYIGYIVDEKIRDAKEDLKKGFLAK